MEDIWAIDYIQIFLRLFLAALLGGIIGYEREINNHPAGFRTHILVSIGSTLIMLISIYGFSNFLVNESVRFDPSRIAAQVVTGIGFLGAGTILRQGFNVIGLTTAASLWVVAAIGLAIGSGFYFGAVLSALLVLISLAVLAKLEKLISKKKHFLQLRVTVIDQPGKLGEIATFLGEKKINVRNVNMYEEDKGEDDHQLVSIVFSIKAPKYESIPFVVDHIKQIKGVKEVKFGKDTE